MDKQQDTKNENYIHHQVITCQCGNQFHAYSKELFEEVIDSSCGLTYDHDDLVFCPKCNTSYAVEAVFSVEVKVEQEVARIYSQPIKYVPIDDEHSVNIKHFYVGDFINLPDGDYTSEGLEYIVRQQQLIGIFNAGYTKDQLEFALN